MATFLIVHGAWSAGWAWRKMRPLLGALGHELITPTCTGVGERMHLASPQVDLATHIADILNVLRFEDLWQVMLVGHSYGGMVATGVADQASERIAHLIYLDAFVPGHGQALIDLLDQEKRDALVAGAQDKGGGWQVPPNPLPSDTSDSDVAWISPRRVPQPLRTLTQPVCLQSSAPAMPRSFIYCTRGGPDDGFQTFAHQARDNSLWGYYELDASHSPHITAPTALAEIFNQIAALK